MLQREIRDYVLQCLEQAKCLKMRRRMMLNTRMLNEVLANLEMCWFCGLENIKLNSMYGLIPQLLTHTEILINLNISMVKFQNISDTINKLQFCRKHNKIIQIKIKNVTLTNSNK